MTPSSEQSFRMLVSRTLANGSGSICNLKRGKMQRALAETYLEC